MFLANLCQATGINIIIGLSINCMFRFIWHLNLYQNLIEISKFVIYIDQVISNIYIYFRM